MKKWVIFYLALFASVSLTAEDYEFRGKHFIASYLKCDQGALEDENRLMEVMINAVEKSGAQILNYSSHIFPGHGVTMVILLSESHASIHTYPEHGACFVDLFTCGSRCSHVAFDEALKNYLNPEHTCEKVLVRDELVEEHHNLLAPLR